MDTLHDKNRDNFRSELPVLKVETFRSGYFTFEVGIDLSKIQPLIDRVRDAKNRFSSMPILPDIAVQLEKEVLASSVFGTNTIEGATLTEEETADVLSGNKQVKEEKERRVTNMRDAYGKAETVAEKILTEVQKEKGINATTPAIVLEEFMITDLHRIITGELTHPLNVPGQYRDNKKGQLTKVGDLEHGGIYTPPKCKKDIGLLIKHFVEWINDDKFLGLGPLIRAPLVHYYFERIHPFWDGNGRVGRVLEALVLKCSGFKYAPFAMSKYYLEHIDEYFTVFNTARKAAEKKQPFPNTVFVEFFLTGMLEVINRLHDRANNLVSYLLYDVVVNNMLQEKKINVRQYTIIHNLLPKGSEHDLGKIQSQPWYKGLYAKLTMRTQYRDLRKMAEAKLIKTLPGRKLRLLIPGRH